MFGENGAVLDKIDEAALERESANRTREYGVMACISSLIYGGFITFILLAYPGALRDPLALSIFAVSGLAAFAPGVLAFAGQAERDARLPGRLGGEPRHAHVAPGMTTLVLILLIGVIWLARLFETHHDDLVIDDRVGLVIVSLIGIAFLSLILVPQVHRVPIFQSFAGMFQTGAWHRNSFWSALTFFPRVLARGISVFDSWKVHAIAPMAGATQKTTIGRYSLLALHLGPAAMLAWCLPAPIGLVPIAWAALIAISVARRWAWTEDDREYALRNPEYEETQLRVGVSEDLRDEALLALLFMIFLLPIGMRQMHQFFSSTGGAFIVPAGAESNPIAWLSFFGAELAKSIPFVDWVDIYGAKNATVIMQNGNLALSSHIVFTARAIVDLVFLAALLQAISVARRWAQHKKMFFNREINLLDPMIERAEFRKLAVRVDNQWEMSERIADFEHYNATRLRVIRLTCPEPSAMYQVATAIMRLRNIPTSSPSEQLSEFVHQKRSDQLAILNAFEAAKAAGDLDIDTLIDTRRELNWKSAFNEMRGELVDRLVALPRSAAQVTALRHILTGPISDSVWPVREKAMLALAPVALSNASVRKAIESAAENDNAKTGRDLARKISREIGPGISVVPEPEPEPEDA